jgi:two-component system chemotaxis response regulator CheB
MLVHDMGIPVVIYSDDASIKSDVLAAGASFEKKPSLQSFDETSIKFFTNKIRTIVEKSMPKGGFAAHHKDSDSDALDDIILPGEDFKVLCIGASTGGPTAVQEVLNDLGENFPLPVLYTQHIDVGADAKMVRWFNQVCPNIPMSIPKDGEIAQPGHVYMAPAEKHLIIDYIKNDLPVLKLSDEPPERFLRPAVNKLFRSAATIYQTNTLAVLLTGMGADGAEGCKVICDRGGWTIVEDKSTCAVFGMPAAAIELGGAREVLPRGEIPKRILELVRK